MKEMNKSPNIVTVSNDAIGASVSSENAATFETAISATGFGKFNLILLTVVTFPSAWSIMMTTSTISYILPVAQCDLNLSLKDKGMLNGIVYTGMISSGLIWGFLSDTSGRKRLLVIGYLLNAVCVILSGVSQNYTLVLVTKFWDGFIISGPYAVITTALSEFHCAKYRARILILMGIMYTSSNIILPLLGWLILPMDINIKFFNGIIELHSWNIYILVSSLPSLMSGFFHMFLPESPKYLMTAGKNDQALDVFKKIYSWNTGKSPSTYPIKMLIDENELSNGDKSKHSRKITVNRSNIQALKEGWKQMTPLFFSPHRLQILLVCTIQFGFMLGLNTIRLWLPQIFTAVTDYLNSHDKEASLCTMLESAQATNETIECKISTDNDAVYYNCMIVAVVTMIGYLLAGTVINNIGKKNILLVSGVISGATGFCLYLSTNGAYVLALSSIFLATSSVCTNVLITVVVDLFPTTLRTTAVSITMVCGRFGSMVGNMVFPILLELGCLPPFATIGAIFFISSSLTFILPGTDLKSLE